MAKLKRNTRSAFNLPVYKDSATGEDRGARKEEDGRKDFARFGSSRSTFRRHRQKGNRLTGQKYTDIYEGRDIRANLSEIIIYRPPVHQGGVF